MRRRKPVLNLAPTPGEDKGTSPNSKEDTTKCDDKEMESWSVRDAKKGILVKPPIVGGYYSAFIMSSQYSTSKKGTMELCLYKWMDATCYNTTVYQVCIQSNLSRMCVSIVIGTLNPTWYHDHFIRNFDSISFLPIF